jgi:hypothetical protein
MRSVDVIRTEVIRAIPSWGDLNQGSYIPFSHGLENYYMGLSLEERELFRQWILETLHDDENKKADGLCLTWYFLDFLLATRHNDCLAPALLRIYIKSLTAFD